MKHLFLLIFFRVTLLMPFFVHTHSLSQENESRIRLAFYNLENFFDTDIDSTRLYNEFTPEGTQGWTLGRYLQKRTNVFKTVMAMGEGSPPDLLGFCEVENEGVLRDLILGTPLKKFDYRVVHYESRDRRGIDVALIYRLDHLSLINSKAIVFSDPSDTTFVTRDILYVSFEVGATDTLHVFVNHWPSRYGGVLASDTKRIMAAELLRKHIDSLTQALKNPKILVMGDFNDTPDDISINKVLRAVSPGKVMEDSDLVHLFTNPDELGFDGTIKYMQNWQIFDHIMISQSLFSSGEGLVFIPGSQRIFVKNFLLTEDERHLGKMLNRTFLGPRYLGGYSDHLPVYIDLRLPVK
jgi:endonuclease/exonuclease/phosphatase family metal-dependent hydrolase